MANAVGGGAGGASGAGDVRAGGAYFELTARDKLTAALDKVRAKVAAFGAFMRTQATRAAVAGGIMSAPLLALYKGGSDRAADTARLARQLELPIAVVNKLKYAADAAGVSIDEVMSDNTGKYDEFLNRAPALDPKLALRAAEAQLMLKDATLSLQNALLPLIETVGPLVRMTSEWVQRNGELVKVVGAGAAVLLAFSAAVYALGPGLRLVVGVGRVAVGTVGALVSVMRALRIGTIASAIALGAYKAAALAAAVVTAALAGGAGLLKGALLLLTSPVLLLVAAVAGLALAFRKDIAEAGTGVAERLKSAFADVGTIFKQTWGGVLDAIKAGNLELAFDIVCAGLKAAWKRLVFELVKGWADFGRAIVDSPLGKLHFALGDPNGLTKGDFLKVFDLYEGKAGKELGDALAKLKMLRDQAAAEAKQADDKYKDYGRKFKGYAEVKGNFSAASARQQFGYASGVNKQNELLAKIADGKGGLPVQIGAAVAGAIAMK